jgi:hypothetical protein
MRILESVLIGVVAMCTIAFLTLVLSCIAITGSAIFGLDRPGGGWLLGITMMSVVVTGYLYPRVTRFTDRLMVLAAKIWR